jgi:hypothetical protein
MPGRRCGASLLAMTAPAASSSEPAERTGATVHLVFGVGSGIASTVYGTITAMATITAWAPVKHPWQLATLVAGTALVFWIAHVYAHGLSESLTDQRVLRPAALKPIARRELGILLAAVLPISALLLGAIGILADTTAVWLALGIGLGQLAAQGARYAQLEHVGRLGGLAAVAANVTLGLLVVALKVSLAH